MTIWEIGGQMYWDGCLAESLIILKVYFKSETQLHVVQINHHLGLKTKSIIEIQDYLYYKLSL